MRGSRRAGFTLAELMIVICIMAIAAMLCADVVVETEYTLRPTRMAREIIASLRYARMKSMSTGNTYGVAIDTVRGHIWVYENTTSWYAVNPMSHTGYYDIWTWDADAYGVTLSAQFTSQSASPYVCAYRPLGSTTNVGTITCSFGNASAVVSIPAVGDPVLIGSKDSW